MPHRRGSYGFRLVLAGLVLAGLGFVPASAPAAGTNLRCAAAGPAIAYQTGPTSPWFFDLHLTGTCSPLLKTTVLELSVVGGGSSSDVKSLPGFSTTLTLTDPATGDSTSAEQIWDFHSTSDVWYPALGRDVANPVGPYAFVIYDRTTCPSPQCDPRGDLRGAGAAVTNLGRMLFGVRRWWVVTRFVMTKSAIELPA